MAVTTATRTKQTELVIDVVGSVGQSEIFVVRAAGQPSRVQVKQWEPFASGEPAADTIIVLCDKVGGGLVEILDRLQHLLLINGTWRRIRSTKN